MDNKWLVISPASYYDNLITPCTCALLSEITHFVEVVKYGVAHKKELTAANFYAVKAEPTSHWWFTVSKSSDSEIITNVVESKGILPGIWIAEIDNGRFALARAPSLAWSPYIGLVPNVEFPFLILWRTVQIQVNEYLVDLIKPYAREMPNVKQPPAFNLSDVFRGFGEWER